jgi:hypothetical protein
MTRTLSLIGLAALAAALFLPWSSVGEATAGVLAGTVKQPALIVLLVPAVVGAALGIKAACGRGRGLAIALLALVGVVIFTAMALKFGSASRSPALGFWLGLVGSSLTLVAGLAAVVRPTAVRLAREQAQLSA